MGGVMTTLALDTLIDWHDPEVASLGRKLMDRTDPADKLAGIRMIGRSGDSSDLPNRARAGEGQRKPGGGSARGFGLMPAISISKRAAMAIQSLLESRSRLSPGKPQDPGQNNQRRDQQNHDSRIEHSGPLGLLGRGGPEAHHALSGDCAPVHMQSGLDSIKLTVHPAWRCSDTARRPAPARPDSGSDKTA